MRTEAIRFNDLPYEVGFKLSRYDEGADVFSWDEQHQVDYNLLRHDIVSFKFENDIENPYLECQLDVECPYFLMPFFQSDGRTLLYVHISNTEYAGLYSDTGQDASAKLQLIFIIESVELIGDAPKKLLYRLHGKSNYIITWNNTVAYSNQTSKAEDGGAPATVILDAILKERFASRTANGYYTRDQMMTESKLPVTYATPQGASLRTVVKQLLMLASSDQSGMYYVKYSSVLNKLVLTSVNSAFSADIPDWNVFDLTQYKRNERGEFKTIGLRSYSPKGGHSIIRNMAGTIVMNAYNHKTRMWKHDAYDLDRMTSFFPNVTETDPIPKQTPDRLKNTIELADASNYYIPLVAEELFRSMEVIEFSPFGALRRDVGDVLQIRDSTNSDSQDIHMLKRYGGKWMVTRINHTFDKASGKFMQKIYAVRASAKPDTFPPNMSIS